MGYYWIQGDMLKVVFISNDKVFQGTFVWERYLLVGGCEVVEWEVLILGVWYMRWVVLFSCL